MARSPESVGRRGPQPGSIRYLAPMPRHVHGEELPNRPVPRAPSGLGTDGRKAWRAVMRHAPLLQPELDVVTVERFSRMVDERAALAGELGRGYLLEEPIVSPTGKVVGERVVANPALSELRRLDKALDDLADRLGLVPAARAKLGLTFTTAERQVAEIDAVLSGMYRKEPQ